MPTYQYRCRDCGQELDVVQSFKDDPLTECPHCQGSLRKVFAAPGITFKGSGFYKNDSRGSAKSSSGPSTTSSGDKGDKGDKGDTSDSKADKKAEAKADAAPAQP